MPPANIVFIHAESMDGRKMGCMGHPALKDATPNLDLLAAEGVIFANAYSNCLVCNPSRASMWTGKYPHYRDCWNNHEGLRDGVQTYRDALEWSGYLIIRGSDVRQGAVVDEPVSLVDLYPTLMDMAGVNYQTLADRPSYA